MTAKRFFLLALAAIMIGSLSAMAGEPLELGDDAPPLKIAKWINGGPVSLQDGKGEKIYVVEFWATWCPPCKASIPHLSELYNKYKDQGVEIVGITREKPKVVEKFAKTADFTYNVGIDDKDQTSDAYMEGVEGIPHAFVIDKQGKIVWSGHPMAELDDVIQQLLGGSYDVEQAEQIQKFEKEIEEAYMAQDIARARKACEEMLGINPNSTKAFNMLTFFCMQDNDAKGFKAQCRKLIENDRISMDMLNEIAWTLVTVEDLAFRDIEMAYEAVQASCKKKKESANTDTLARIYFELGDFAKAIESQQESISLAESAKEKKSLEQTLAYYQSVEEAAQTLE
jgi:peroxiredoxin